MGQGHHCPAQDLHSAQSTELEWDGAQRSPHKASLDEVQLRPWSGCIRGLQSRGWASGAHWKLGSL